MQPDEKAQIIANSISNYLMELQAAGKKMSGKFIKQLKQKLKNSGDIDFSEIYDNIKGYFSFLIESFKEFENKPQSKLDGLSIKEYINGIDNIERLLQIAIAVSQEKSCAFPVSFTKKMKIIPESEIIRLKEYAIEVEKSSSGKLSPEQLAIVRLCGLNGNGEFARPLAGILLNLDQNADEIDIKTVCDSLTAIGSHAVDPLMDFIKNSSQEGLKYEYAIMALGSIGREHRKEDIFRLLKDLFRKSKNRLVEAEALALLGDGRIIPALRGHVERNLDSIDHSEYERFRDIIIELGGDTSDLDELYDFMDDYYEYEDDEDDQ